MIDYAGGSLKISIQGARYPEAAEKMTGRGLYYKTVPLFFFSAFEIEAHRFHLHQFYNT